jgi:predicted metal-dependent RNase
VRWTCAQNKFVSNSKFQFAFLAMAAEVTASCYLMETPHVTFLVDCGMFQGGRKLIKKFTTHSLSTLKRSNSFYLPTTWYTGKR